jgi:hypothetical protein
MQTFAKAHMEERIMEDTKPHENKETEYTRGYNAGLCTAAALVEETLTGIDAEVILAGLTNSKINTK